MVTFRASQISEEMFRIVYYNDHWLRILFYNSFMGVGFLLLLNKYFIYVVVTSWMGEGSVGRSDL